MQNLTNAGTKADADPGVLPIMFLPVVMRPDQAIAVTTKEALEMVSSTIRLNQDSGSHFALIPE
jgi:hypothetical protein